MTKCQKFSQGMWTRVRRGSRSGSGCSWRSRGSRSCLPRVPASVRACAAPSAPHPGQSCEEGLVLVLVFLNELKKGVWFVRERMSNASCSNDDSCGRLCLRQHPNYVRGVVRDRTSCHCVCASECVAVSGRLLLPHLRQVSPLLEA